MKCVKCQRWMKEREQKKDWGDLPFSQIRRSVVTWEVAFFLLLEWGAVETRLKVKGKFSEEMKAASIFFLRNTYSLNSRCLQERICSFQECLEGNSSKPLSLRLIWMYVENRWAGFYTHTCEKEKNMGYFLNSSGRRFSY